MKEVLCKTIEKHGGEYHGIAMSIPVTTREREGRGLDKGVTYIVVAPNLEALEHAKKLLQGDIYEPLEKEKCKRVYVGEIKGESI